MDIPENVAVSTSIEHELAIGRLAKIDGIARKTAEALHQLDIHGYADLAQYLSQHTAQQVSVGLKTRGVNRPPGFIDREAWIRQARALSELQDTAPPLSKEEIEMVEIPQEARSGRSAREHDAVFTLSFDIERDDDNEPVLHTIVRDGTNGGQAGVFEGNDSASWIGWIRERTNLPLAVQLPTGQTEAAGSLSLTRIDSEELPVPKGSGDAQLEICDVHLSVKGPTSIFPEKRLVAEIQFQLDGADTEALTSRGIPVRIEGYTVDMESGAAELVATGKSRLEPQVFEYKSSQEFGIPKVGRYEFYCIVLLLPPGQMAAYHRGPTMRIVP